MPTRPRDASAYDARVPLPRRHAPKSLRVTKDKDAAAMRCAMLSFVHQIAAHTHAAYYFLP